MIENTLSEVKENCVGYFYPNPPNKDEIYSFGEMVQPSSDPGLYSR